MNQLSIIVVLFFARLSYVIQRKESKGVNDVSPTVVISIMIALIVLLLFMGAPIKPTRFIAHSTVKLGIGFLFLFFLNVFGGAIGLHIPINLFTIIISGFLGLLGISSLVAIQTFLL